MNACPHCGGKAGYSVRVRAIGYAVHEGDWSGITEHIADDSNLRRIAQKTVKCLECDKRVPMSKVREQ